MKYSAPTEAIKLTRSSGWVEAPMQMASTIAETPIDEQTPLGKVQIYPKEVIGLRYMLGIPDDEHRPVSWLLNTLIARVKESDPSPKPVALSGEAAELRRLAGLDDNASASEVFHAISAKFLDSMQGKNPDVVRRARIVSGMEDA